jgi:hypothetical protein
MNKPLEENNMTTLAELEARARALESELAGVQAAIAMLRATADGNNTPAQGREVPLTPAWDAPIPIAVPPQSRPSDNTTDTGYIHLQALQPYHVLRAKWGLGSGLEDAQTPEVNMPENQATETASELRLFGLLSDGVAWEQRIPFIQIAQEGGLILGRDPELAHVTVDDASVSRAHLQLQLNESGLVANDMGSTNGSAINDEALEAYHNCRAIHDGDTLTMGCISLQVEFI